MFSVHCTEKHVVNKRPEETIFLLLQSQWKELRTSTFHVTMSHDVP
jgi:hypothetical protein